MLPQTTKSDPRQFALAPYNLCLRCLSQIAVPKLVTLNTQHEEHTILGFTTFA